MCGIVGIVAKRNAGFYHATTDLFQQMLVADSTRGEDATGAFVVNRKNTVRIIKAAAIPHDLFRTKNWDAFKASAFDKGLVLVGHNRKATIGSITRETAHPFYESNIVLVHNGTINNKEELNKEVEVDSHAICHAIAEKGYKEAIKSIDGAFALVWYDLKEQSLNIVRNDKRPMAYGETEDFLVFASEGPMLDWLLWRNNLKAKHGINELPVEKLLKVTRGDQDINIDIEGVEVKKFYPPVVQWPERSTKVYDMYGNTLGDGGDEEEPDPVGVPVVGVLTRLAKIHEAYPSGCTVIFSPKYMRKDSTADRFKLYGSAYLPGKEVIHDARVFFPESVSEDEAAELGSELKLTATLKGFVITNDQQIVATLENVKPDIELKTWLNMTVLNTEWDYITQHMKCSKCGGELNNEFSSITSVNCNSSFENWKCTCDICVGKNKDTMSKEKRDAYESACRSAV